MEFFNNIPNHSNQRELETTTIDKKTGVTSSTGGKTDTKSKTSNSKNKVTSSDTKTND